MPKTNPDDEDVLSLPAGGWKDTERVQRLVDGIRQSDAIQQSMEEARQSVQPRDQRPGRRPRFPEKDALEDLARFIVDRKI